MERLKNAACAAQSLGLHLDINLGSAWPTGSPAVGKFETERQLLLAELDSTGPMSFEGALPEPSEPGWMELARNLLQSVGAFDNPILR